MKLLTTLFTLLLACSLSANDGITRGTYGGWPTTWTKSSRLVSPLKSDYEVTVEGMTEPVPISKIYKEMKEKLGCEEFLCGNFQCVTKNKKNQTKLCYEASKSQNGGWMDVLRKFKKQEPPFDLGEKYFKAILSSTYTANKDFRRGLETEGEDVFELYKDKSSEKEELNEMISKNEEFFEMILKRKADNEAVELFIDAVNSSVATGAVLYGMCGTSVLDEEHVDFNNYNLLTGFGQYENCVSSDMQNNENEALYASLAHIGSLYNKNSTGEVVEGEGQGKKTCIERIGTPNTNEEDKSCISNVDLRQDTSLLSSIETDVIEMPAIINGKEVKLKVQVKKDGQRLVNEYDITQSIYINNQALLSENCGIGDPVEPTVNEEEVVEDEKIEIAEDGVEEEKIEEEVIEEEKAEIAEDGVEEEKVEDEQIEEEQEVVAAASENEKVEEKPVSSTREKTQFNKKKELATVLPLPGEFKSLILENGKVPEDQRDSLNTQLLAATKSNSDQVKLKNDRFIIKNSEEENVRYIYDPKTGKVKRVSYEKVGVASNNSEKETPEKRNEDSEYSNYVENDNTDSVAISRTDGREVPMNLTLMTNGKPMIIPQQKEYILAELDKASKESDKTNVYLLEEEGKKAYVVKKENELVVVRENGSVSRFSEKSVVTSKNLQAPNIYNYSEGLMLEKRDNGETYVIGDQKTRIDELFSKNSSKEANKRNDIKVKDKGSYYIVKQKNGVNYQYEKETGKVTVLKDKKKKVKEVKTEPEVVTKEEPVPENKVVISSERNEGVKRVKARSISYYEESETLVIIPFYN